MPAAVALSGIVPSGSRRRVIEDASICAKGEVFERRISPRTPTINARRRPRCATGAGDPALDGAQAQLLRAATDARTHPSPASPTSVSWESDWAYADCGADVVVLDSSETAHRASHHRGTPRPTGRGVRVHGVSIDLRCRDYVGFARANRPPHHPARRRRHLSRRGCLGPRRPRLRRCTPRAPWRG